MFSLLGLEVLFVARGDHVELLRRDDQLRISTWKEFRVLWVGNWGPWKGSPMKWKKASQPPGIMRPRNSAWVVVCVVREEGQLDSW